MAESFDGAEVAYIPDVIHSLNDPVYVEGATVRRGASSNRRPSFLKHRGKAIIFEDYNT